MKYLYNILLKKRAVPSLLLTSALIIIVISLTGCATTGVNRGDMNLISRQQEWQLGSQLEGDLSQKLDLVNDQATLAYISLIGRKIVSQTEMANMPWEFHLVNDPAVNAFNIPGGHIYVHTGLIKTVDNVSELAGVMAHEIAHGVSRHGTERITKVYGLNIAAGLVLGKQPAVYEQILAQIAGTGAIAKVSRSDESEADRLGVRYMHGAGYNPDGMASIFQKLLAADNRGSNAVAQFFATHPLTSNRIKEVRQEASSLPSRKLVTRDNQLGSIKKRISKFK